MSELASYSIQAIFFALVAVVVVSRSKKTDLYQFALISIWLVGVIAIYARYGESQVFFYSNDQDFHKLIIDYYIPVEGIHLDAIFGLRYVLTVPVYLVAKTGFDAMLLLKFIQLVFLLLLYRQARDFLSRSSVVFRFWHTSCIAGPITVFMSLLSLRDLILAYSAVAFMANRSIGYRLLVLSLALSLRPHLAVALAFGFVVSELFMRIYKTKPILYLVVFSVMAYALGCLAFPIGAYIQHNAVFEGPSTVFSQLKFSRLVINFVGLQFLALNDENGLIVARSTFSLLISRIVFFDTILIPILFLKSTFIRVFFQTKEKVMVLLSFMFFYGIVSQTTWNSTRQNIPFLACMGVLAVADIEHFRKIKAKVAPKLLTATR
jgi:hypothetical protein